jgi:predicted Zn-dependent peptidase
MYLDLPSQYVHEVMSELLWPAQALGRPIAGTLKTVSDLKRNDLWRHVQAYYHPRNMLVTACGEINHAEIRELSETYFSNGYKRSVSQYEKAKVSSNAKPDRFRFIDKKTEQTHFVMAFHSLSRNHPDRYKLAALNVI